MTDTSFDAEALADLQTRHPGLTPHQILEILGGRTTEARMVERRALDAAEAPLRQTDPDKWPTPDLDWDLDPANFHRSMDTHSAEAFAEDFGEIGLHWVGVDHLVDALASTAKRTGSPFDEAYRGKTRRLIAHLDRRPGDSAAHPLGCRPGRPVPGGRLSSDELGAAYEGRRHSGPDIRAAHMQMVKLKVTLAEDAGSVSGLRGLNEGDGKP